MKMPAPGNVYLNSSGLPGIILPELVCRIMVPKKKEEVCQGEKAFQMSFSFPSMPKTACTCLNLKAEDKVPFSLYDLIVNVLESNSKY